MKIYDININDITDIEKAEKIALVQLKKKITRQLKQRHMRGMTFFGTPLSDITHISKLTIDEQKQFERALERKITKLGFSWKVTYIYHDTPKSVYMVNGTKKYKAETIVFLIEDLEHESKGDTTIFVQKFNSLDTVNVFRGEMFINYLTVIYGRSYVSTLELKPIQRVGRIIAKFRAYMYLKKNLERSI